MASPGSPMFDQATNYFNSGQYVQAADLYQQDLRLNPQHPLTHYYFGVSLHCLGRAPEATREYNWILLNTTDPELIRRAQSGNEDFVNTYKVRSYPTILFFATDGRLVKRIDGAPQTSHDFEIVINEAFPRVH